MLRTATGDSFSVTSATTHRPAELRRRIAALIVALAIVVSGALAGGAPMPPSAMDQVACAHGLHSDCAAMHAKDGAAEQCRGHASCAAALPVLAHVRIDMPVRSAPAPRSAPGWRSAPPGGFFRPPISA